MTHFLFLIIKYNILREGKCDIKNKWYVLLGIVLSLFSILIVSPIYIDGIKEGIKTGIENSKENVDQVVLDKNDQKSEENANYVYNVINSD